MIGSASRSAPRLAALALLAGGVLIASCRDEEAKDGGPGPALSLEIELRAPGTQTVSELCTSAARAVLVTIDDDDAGSLRTFQFLFSTSGGLYGCGGVACTAEESVLQTALVDPRKVTVEVIDVLPDQFEPNTSYDVLCRGVADARLGTELMIAGTALRASVKMLRVGGINPLFDGTADHPTHQFLAGSPLQATPANGPLARTASGGGIVFAGGYGVTTKSATDAIHLFDPLTLSLRAAPVTMRKPRGGLTATAIEGPDGRSRVLFAGGATSTTAAAFNSGELYDARTQDLAVIPLYRPRSGHSAVYLPRYDDNGGAGPRPAVALLGGCAVGICAGGPVALAETGSLEAFYLDSPPAGAGGFCTSIAGSAGSCTFSVGEGAPCGSNCANPGRSLAAAGPLKGPGSDFYVGHGYAPSPTNEAVATSHLVDGHTFGNYPSGSFPTFAPATASLDTARLLVLGGFTLASGALDKAVVIAPGGPLLTSANMRVARGAPTATTLLDGRVVVAGGNTGIFLNSTLSTNTVEIFDQDATPVFALLARLGEVCAAPGDAGCETMAQPRARHAAVRIDGSLSWVNGAVVFAGGRQVPGDTVDPEIFVPAYPCVEGAIPPGLQGQIDFCDRGRIAVTPTDPRTP